jgi:hypothetical protein
VAIPLLGLLHVGLGIAWPPAVKVAEHGASLAPLTALEWTWRIVLTVAIAVSAVLGPGVLLRRRVGSASLQNTALVWIPGVLVLAAMGLVAWLLAYRVDPARTSAVLLTPLLLLLVWAAWRAPPRSWFRPGEAAVCGLVLLLLSVGVAKGTWSQGPKDELYGGTVSRTLETDRSDSRISYHVVQLIAHGTERADGRSRYYFGPYTFSDRGPLAGLSAAPIVLSSGAAPPLASRGDERWVPFDGQGFAAYRIVLELLGATVLLSVFGLLRTFASLRVAWAGTVLVALTPFVVHETYFTWPKLLAASFGIAALAAVMSRRPGLVGVLLGLSYLSHPVGLFIAVSVVSTGIALALWGSGRTCRARTLLALRSSIRQTVKIGVWMALGIVVPVLVWWWVNAGHFTQQENFATYLRDANGVDPGALSRWVASRLRSLGNTLVPFQLLIWDHDEPHVNPIFNPLGPLVIPFFYQYWNTVPFGVGLVYFPMFLVGLWRFARRSAAVFLAGIALPFAAFAVYWGSYVTGLMREGLHGWIVFALVGAFLGHSVIEPVGLGRWAGVVRGCVTLRGLEVLAMLLVPTVVTMGWLGAGQFVLTDLAALSVMVGGVTVLMLLAWRAFDPTRLRLGLEVPVGETQHRRGAVVPANLC